MDHAFFFFFNFFFEQHFFKIKKYSIYSSNFSFLLEPFEIKYNFKYILFHNFLYSNYNLSSFLSSLFIKFFLLSYCLYMLPIKLIQRTVYLTSFIIIDSFFSIKFDILKRFPTLSLPSL